MLNEAAQGRYESLMALSHRCYGDRCRTAIMHGMQLSVICTEDGSELKADPADEDTVLGTDFVTFTWRAVRGLAEGQARRRISARR